MVMRLNPEKETGKAGENAEKTPLEKHGALSVRGTKLVDEKGNPVQLYGMSTRGLAWHPQYINEDTFRSLRDEWHNNCVRLAMFTGTPRGYCGGANRVYLKEMMRKGVDAATRLGMYVIIDWHVLVEKSPNVYADEAVKFFDEMSSVYRDQDNVIYEICNEPNTASDWADIRAYAEKVIPVIRKNDPDAVIIVGTPTWSQDVDQAAENPLPYDHLLYTLHFYADTHRQELRDRAEKALQAGLPIIVSEFNCTSADGNGTANTEEGDLWMELIRKHNLSFLCWSLSNHPESSAVLLASCDKTSGWEEEDLDVTGKWVLPYFAAAYEAEKE